MEDQELKEIWKKEESIAYIHGWDFSHLPLPEVGCPQRGLH